MDNLHIRWMLRADMERVQTIENESFAYPWSENDFIRTLRHRNCIGMVCEVAGCVAGYMIYELQGTRITMLNFAVDVAFRRHGIGTLMAQKIIGKLSIQRRKVICLEVRESNLPAQLFWKAMGFEAYVVIHEAYEDSDEDAYAFRYRICQEATI